MGKAGNSISDETSLAQPRTQAVIVWEALLET